MNVVGSKVGVAYEGQQGTGKATVLQGNQIGETVERFGLLNFQQQQAARAAKAKAEADAKNEALKMLNGWKLEGESRWQPKIYEKAQTEVFDWMLEKMRPDATFTQEDSFELVKRMKKVDAENGMIQGVEKALAEELDWATKNADKLNPNSIKELVEYGSPENYEKIKNGTLEKPRLRFKNPVGEVFSLVNDAYKTLELTDKPLTTEQDVETFWRMWTQDPTNRDQLPTLTTAYYDTPYADPDSPMFKTLPEWLAKSTKHLYDKDVKNEAFDLSKVLSTFDAKVKDTFIGTSKKEDGTSAQYVNQQGLNDYVDSVIWENGGWKRMGFEGMDHARSYLRERAMSLNSGLNYDQEKSATGKSNAEEILDEQSKDLFLDYFYSGDPIKINNAFNQAMRGQDAGFFDEQYQGFSMISVENIDTLQDSPQDGWVTIKVAKSKTPTDTESLLAALEGGSVPAGVVTGDIRINLRSQGARQQGGSYYNRFMKSGGERFIANDNPYSRRHQAEIDRSHDAIMEDLFKD